MPNIMRPNVHKTYNHPKHHKNRENVATTAPAAVAELLTVPKHTYFRCAPTLYNYTWGPEADVAG